MIDVIVIGEIRDKETAEIAMQAGQTGHYVLSTIHTINAIEVITRLRKLGISNYDIASTLATAISQRLVRKICPKCATQREFTEQEKEALGFNIKYNVFIKYQDLINKYKCVDFSNMREGYEYFSLFILKGIREITTKKNDLMAFVSIEDESQMMDGVIFSDAYNNLKHELLVGYVYIAKVKLDIRKTNDDVKKQIVISNLRKI